jgi:hypothetical protein
MVASFWMHSLIPLSLFLAVLNLCPLALTTVVPFEVRVGTSPSTHLARRAANTSVPISNTGNAQYIGNITLGGAVARVMLDTGRCAIRRQVWSLEPRKTD